MEAKRLELAKQGDLELFKEYNAQFMTHKDEIGNTALKEAAEKGHANCVEFLAQYELK